MSATSLNDTLKVIKDKSVTLLSKNIALEIKVVRNLNIFIYLFSILILFSSLKNLRSKHGLENELKETKSKFEFELKEIASKYEEQFKSKANHEVININTNHFLKITRLSF